MPLPVRCCSGMRHCQPAPCAVARVNGGSDAARALGTAMARSHGSQCASSRTAPAAPRRAAGCESPSSRRTGRPRSAGRPPAAAARHGRVVGIAVDRRRSRPSIRSTPLASARRAQERGVERRHRNDRHRRGRRAATPGRRSAVRTCPSARRAPSIAEYPPSIADTATRLQLQPDLVEIRGPAIDRAMRAERVEIAVARSAPVDELDAELEGAWVARTNSSSSMPSIRLKPSDRRDRRLADADGADLVRIRPA